MNRISMGMNQAYPVYPNCFDQLTTHGIIAEDLVGYVTGQPSPYLQNYVAQRGFPATLPGQILPDALPHMMPNYVMPKTNIPTPAMQPAPQQTPQQQNQQQQNNIFSPTTHIGMNSVKKILFAGLLVGLTTLGIFKGKSIINFIKNKFTSPIPPTPTPSPATGNFFQRAWTNIKNYFC